jgi:hypothetical protein
MRIALVEAGRVAATHVRAPQRKGTLDTGDTFSDVAFDSGFRGAVAELVGLVRGIGQPIASCWDSLPNRGLVRAALEA